MFFKHILKLFKNRNTLSFSHPLRYITETVTRQGRAKRRAKKFALCRSLIHNTIEEKNTFCFFFSLINNIYNEGKWSNTSFLKDMCVQTIFEAE
jgi:hypothetical protein